MLEQGFAISDTILTILIFSLSIAAIVNLTLQQSNLNNQSSQKIKEIEAQLIQKDFNLDKNCQILNNSLEIYSCQVWIENYANNKIFFF